MTNMKRDECIQLIENDYFGNLTAGHLSAAMECFTDDARVYIRHGDNPIRRFSILPSDGMQPLMEFYEHLCGNYYVTFTEFWHVIDIDAQRAASHFTVGLAPMADGLYADAAKQELLNCNFFEFRDGRISHMIIYYANPASANENNQVTPTGYPR